MAISRQAILKTGVALTLAAFGAILMIGLGPDGTRSTVAQQEPAMQFRIGSCTADCEVLVGQGFALSVDATVLPEGGFGAFGVEIYLGQQQGADGRTVEGGMVYRQRDCDEDVLIEPLGLCLGPTIPTSGQIILGGITALGQLLPSTSTNLVELAVTCPAEGEHEVVLTAYPSSSLGALFQDVNEMEVLVQTVGTRSVPERDPVDPGAIAVIERDVAAVMDVSCVTELSGGGGDDGDGGTAAPTATQPSGLPGTGAGTTATGGASVSVWAIAAMLAFASAALGLLGWRARRAVGS